MQAKRLQFHNREDDENLETGEYAEAVKAAFGARLQRLHAERGWNQSDLARAAARYMPSGQFARDLISKYVRGSALPQPHHLEALAKALGVEKSELLPEKGVPSSGNRKPSLTIRSIGDGRVWIQVNRAMPTALAVKILALLDEAG